jgi:hypothetical protein
MSDAVTRLTDALSGRYRIERELGQGGMATVYLAHDLRHDRKVALKVLRPELAAVIGAARFLQEIKTTANLQHPHILSLHDSGEVDGTVFYVMPFVDGESLRDRLSREKQLPVGDAVRIATEAADALEYAHRHGVIHRDIKPENILLSDGQALVADFGVAKAAGEIGAERLTGTGLALGTPAYMSPEQAAGSRELDGRSDQYSLGCVLYEMLAGEPPFTGPTPQAVIGRRFVEPPPSLHLLRAGVPEALERVVLQALAREPADRFSTAADFVRALSAAPTAVAVPDRGSMSEPLSRAPLRLRMVGRRRLSPWVLLLGIGLLLGLGAGVSGLLRLTRVPSKVIDADLVVVAPFEVLDPSLQLWHEGLVDVLARDLDGAGPLRTVSPTVAVRRWSGRADPASVQALGRDTGAKLAVYGSLGRAGSDSVRFTATIFDIARGRALGGLEVRGAMAELGRLTDSLAVGLLRQIGRTRPVGAMRHTGLGARSLPALEAYLQAEQHYRQAEWDSTRMYAQQAIALDNTFALAYRRLGSRTNPMRWETIEDPLANAYGKRAGALNHGLPPRDSLLVLADSLLQGLTHGVSLAGVYASPALGQRLFATLEEAVRRYPEDPEAWYALGEARYHFGIWLVRAGGWRVTREAFERSIALDSLFNPAYTHLVELSYALGGTARIHRYIAGLIRVNPQSVQAAGLHELQHLLALPDSDARARLIDSLPNDVFWEAYTPLARWPDSAEVAVHIVRDRVRATRSKHEDLHEARFHLAHALAFRGHLREALALGDTLSPVLFAEAALLGYVPTERARAIFSAWLRLGDAPYLPRPALALPWWGAHRDTSALQGFVHLVDSMTTTARSYGTLSPDELVRLGQMVAAARAQQALARQDTSSAISAYYDVLGGPAPCAYWCQTDQLLAARILATRSPLDAARILNAPATIEASMFNADVTPAPRPSDVLWYLERGRVAERLSDKARAIEAYRYVADVWQRPDPELEPYAAEARAGVARLTAELRQ